MIRLAYYQRADDLHLAPCRDSQGPALLVRCRIDGILHTIARIDLRLLGALMERWKSMAALNVAERHLPQDGRIALVIDGRDVDIRVATMPTAMGESLTARLLVRESVNLEIEKMGYCDADRRKVLDVLRQPSGLVIVNGPTGAGKTTTLYGCLSVLAGPETKIMTVEDPVEFLVPWALQTP